MPLAVLPAAEGHLPVVPRQRGLRLSRQRARRRRCREASPACRTGSCCPAACRGRRATATTSCRPASCCPAAAAASSADARGRQSWGGSRARCACRQLQRGMCTRGASPPSLAVCRTPASACGWRPHPRFLRGAPQKSLSGIAVTTQCIQLFEQLKSKGAYRFLTFKVDSSGQKVRPWSGLDERCGD